MVLAHEFSSYRLELVFNDDFDVDEIQEFLEAKVKTQISKSLMPITTMNQHGYGELMIQIQGIPNYQFLTKVSVVIELDPFTLSSTVNNS